MTLAVPSNPIVLPHRVAGKLHVPLEEIQDTQPKFLDILHSSAPPRITLSSNNAILEPAETVWHTPTTCRPTLRGAQKIYYALAKGSEFLFSPPLPNSLVVQAATERAR